MRMDVSLGAPDPDLKGRVREFWDAGSCGEVYARGGTELERFDSHATERYRLEPYIHGFARFEDGSGKDVLEVGVGMGADHTEWARSRPRSLSGVDLTPRAVQWTRRRVAAYGLSSDLRVADAEALPFPDASFDIVYSWGVIHCTPDTPRAFREIHRVLRPGGTARIMVYHTHSLVGYMLWARYGLLAGRPGRSLADIYAEHLESPGTKAYTVAEARSLCSDFSRAEITTCLALGDLLVGEVGQRHGGPLLTVAKALWPRRLIKRFLPQLGCNLMIEAIK